MKFVLTLFALILLTSFSFTGCSSTSEVVYGGSVRSSEELNGQMRLAENSVEVNVVGNSKTATLTNTGNYYVVWVEDLIHAVNSIKWLRIYKQAALGTVGPEKFAEIEKRFNELKNG